MQAGFGGAGGIANVNGIVLLQNTIIARNDTAATSAIVPSDCSGPVTSLGNNLIGDPTQDAPSPYNPAT